MSDKSKLQFYFVIFWQLRYGRNKLQNDNQIYAKSCGLC